MAEPRFPLGQTVATPGALEALSKAGEAAHKYITRHAAGDWVDLDSEDRAENERSVNDASRIFSAYSLRDGTRIYVITEADRSATTILLPEEY